MKRLFQILFWSIIAAAFIGPGTVTTAASSGTRFGFSLLWALLFSTVACLILQEASARITVVSGYNLGQAIRKQFQGGAVGLLVLLLVLGAIVLGCAAYEAGNILGAVAGAGLGFHMSPKFLTIIIGLLSGLLLYFGTTKIVARILGVIVALMGIAFLVTAVLIKPSITDIFRGTLIPTIPKGSSILVLGLIGTTVVPYNLFLGSGIARGQKLGELRFGLSIAVVFGGLISMAVLVVGTSIAGDFTYQALAQSISTKLGDWAALFFAFGLFAAGFSSAVTAPLAAAITAKSLFDSDEKNKWHEFSWRYRSIWFGVLFAGIFFGLIDVKPIPAIILAQALNGVLLPFVAVFLFLVVNDRSLMGKDGLNNLLANVITGIIVFVSIILGISNLVKAGIAAFGLSQLNQNILFNISVFITLIIAIPVVRVIFRKRGK